jgi:hypothetical protein
VGGQVTDIRQQTVCELRGSKLPQLKRQLAAALQTSPTATALITHNPLLSHLPDNPILAANLNINRDMELKHGSYEGGEERQCYFNRAHDAGNSALPSL